MKALDVFWLCGFVFFASSFAFKREKNLLRLKNDVFDTKEVNDIIEEEFHGFHDFNQNLVTNGKSVYLKATKQ